MKKWGNEGLKGLNVYHEVLTSLPKYKFNKLKYVSQFKDLSTKMTSDDEKVI